MTGGPLRSVDEVKAGIAAFLADLDVQEVEEYDEEDSWGFLVKFGSFPLYIDNEKGKRYCIVAFQVTLPPGEAVTKLNELYAKNDFRFCYDLARAFSSPVTGFSRVLEGPRIVGYTVSKYIHPFHPGFTIEDLDGALQAVVSVGTTGIMFLKSVLGRWEEEKIAERELSRSDPGPMYR